MQVLVTGATGLLGNNVVRELIGRGAAVRVLTRPASNPRPLADLNVKKISANLSDETALASAAEGCDVVIHSAACVHIGWTRGDEARETNVEGTRRVARAALSAGARLVHVSSIDALGRGSRSTPVDETTEYTPRFPCPYAVTKREAEKVVLQLRNEGLDAVIVNPSFLLGPWDWKPSSGRLILEVARRRFLVAPRAMIDFAHVADVAAAICTAAQSAPSGERYILSGERMTYLKGFRTIAQVCGARGPWFTVGRPALYSGGWLGNLATRFRGNEGDVNSASVGLLLEPHFFSHQKATAELDYHPRSLAAAAEDAWRWFREHGYA